MKKPNKGSSKPTLGFPSRKAFVESNLTSDQILELMGDMSFDKYVARAIRRHASCNEEVLTKMAIEHKNYGVRAGTIMFMQKPGLAYRDPDKRVLGLVIGAWLNSMRLHLDRLRVVDRYAKA